MQQGKDIIRPDLVFLTPVRARAWDRKSRVLDLFIDGKISDEEKDVKIDEIESGANTIRLQRIDADEYVNNKEQIIDGALLFMSNPALFWNQSGLEVRKRLQDSFSGRIDIRL